MLEDAERALAADPPACLLGYERMRRANALGELGRFEVALAAWDELCRHGRAHPGYVEIARIGRVRSLLGLGSLSEANKALAELARDALTEETRAWAAAQSLRDPSAAPR